MEAFLAGDIGVSKLDLMLVMAEDADKDGLAINLQVSLAGGTCHGQNGYRGAWKIVSNLWDAYYIFARIVCLRLRRERYMCSELMCRPCNCMQNFCFCMEQVQSVS
jgi:hypothetical protein